MQVEDRLLKQAQESGKAFDTGELQLSSQTQEAALSSETSDELQEDLTVDPAIEENEIGAVEETDEAPESPESTSELSSELQDNTEKSSEGHSNDDLSETEKYMAGLAKEARLLHGDARTQHDPSEL